MTTTLRIKNGDVVIDNRGQPKLLADGPKLSQDLGECLAINTQENGFGAGLEAMIGLLGDEFSLRAEVSRRVTTSIETMRSLQNRFHRSARPAQERINRIKSIKVSSIQDKKTTALFRVEVVTADGNTTGSSGGLG